MDVFAAAQGVANFEGAVAVGQTYNIARIGLVDRLLLLGHKGRWAAELHHLALADVLVVHVSLELTRADFHKGDTAAVVGVHIGVDFKDKARKSVLFWFDFPLNGLGWLRTWRYFAETV